MNRRQVLLPLGSCVTSAAAPAAAPSVAPGWDWSLPAGSRPLSYSGYVVRGNKHYSDQTSVSGVQIPWSSVSRAPGEYDFSGLEKSLRDARDAGVRIGLH